MSSGDQQDMFQRIKGYLPHGWFGDAPDNIDALCRAAANMLAFNFSQLTYSKNQTRINSASDGWLDLIAGDFFGNQLPRKPGEADAVYRARIISSISVEKGTRQAVIKAVEALLGVTPTLFEPANPADTGGYGVACGYNVAGGYGSTTLPFNFFVRVPPLAQPAALPSNGYGGPLGGYGGGLIRYADSSDFNNYFNRAAICAAVNQVRPINSVGWIGIATHG